MRCLWILTILLCLGVIMGKADIVSGGEDGHYNAKIKYNTDAIDQQIADIDVRLGELDDAMTELEGEKSEYEDQVEAARSAMQAEMDAWMAKFEAWRSEMAGQEFPPLFAGVTIPEDFVKDKWSDRIKHTLRDEAYEPEPSRNVTLAGQFPALEGAPAMDDLVKAQAEYGKIRAAIDAIAREISYKEYEQEELRKRKEELQDVLDTLDSDEREVWCADLTEDLSGEQQTIEVKGEPTQILLTPGWRDPDTGEAHWNMDAGKLMPIMGMSAAQAAFNYMILPGWQKWKPMYRVGTITEIDHDEDTATVELDEALSVAQDLDVNQATTLEEVPIKYMDCNSGAFVTDDRVVVEFTGQDWASPQVIGFETEPQPCDKIFYFCQQWRRVNDSIVDPRDLPNGGVKTLVKEAEDEEGEDIEWEYVDPDGGGSWPDYVHFEIGMDIFPVGAGWNEGIPVDSWGGVLLFDSTDIAAWITTDLVGQGLFDLWADHAGTDYVMAYNKADQQIYVFLRASNVEDTSYASIQEEANIQNYLYFIPHDDASLPDDEYGGTPQFESYLIYAPTEDNDAGIGDLPTKHNNRRYFLDFNGDHGNPDQDPAEMAIVPGYVDEPPETAYISYMSDMPQDLESPYTYAENLDSIIDGDGTATVYWPMRSESELAVLYYSGGQFYLHSKSLDEEHLGEDGTFSPPDDPCDDCGPEDHESCDCEGFPVNFTMTVEAEGHQVFTGSSNDPHDGEVIDGLLDLTDYPAEESEYEHVYSALYVTAAMNITFAHSSEYPTKLYASISSYSGGYWCEVADTACADDARGGLKSAGRMAPGRTKGGLINFQ